MRGYALCDVLNVTTAGIEMLAEHRHETGTPVFILVRPEGALREYYRVVGSVERRERRHGRWLYVIRSSNSRPWSPMFIYDVMYQALNGPKRWPVPEWVCVENPAEQYLDREYNNPAMEAELKQAVSHHGTVEVPEPDSDDGDPVVYRALARFAPFDKFKEPLRHFIARQQRVTRRPAGTTLVERGSMENVSIYLIEGTVAISTFDDKTFSIAGGTNDARFPISVLRPHAYTVKAVTDVTVILFSQDLIRQLARITASSRNHLGIEVSEVESMPAGATGT